ncbi:hypothetical protein [uncultured Thiodictyon sp.]|jgi:hypothetical protein|uniref:hypothetical protein n=1 Tax=uncultured Thiodictyon sp. TaxID=1846217 RepID=UPI0025E39A2F|nr:hypothetical protein [uncultured Thiodictyon sp.]
MTPLETAQAFLSRLLTHGPVRSSRVRTEALAAGLAWRTIERAAQGLGVAVRKRGNAWEWSLPGTEAPARAAASPPPPGPRVDLPGVSLAEVAALLERAASMLRRVDGSAPAPAQAPAPGARSRPGDWRTMPASSPPVGRWGSGGLVRCTECQRFAEVSDAGECAAGGRQIRWPYARRTCPAFAPDRQEVTK